MARNSGNTRGDGDVMLLARAAAALMPLMLLHVSLLVAGKDAAETTPIAQPRTSSLPYYRFNISKDDIFHDTRVIPVEHQVSDFLYKGETKLFFFLHEQEHSPLSLTVTPCTSSVLWSVRYRHQNDTGKLDDVAVRMGGNNSDPPLEEFRSNEMRTFSSEKARPGLYMLQVSPLERETYVKLYASLQTGGPHPLRLSQRPRLRLQKRQRRKRLTVRWEPSSVDPHLMHYCLVVNTRRYYSTLCEAQGERNGVSPPVPSHTAGFNSPSDQDTVHKSELASKAAKLNASRLGRGSGGAGPLHEDIVVGCVGRRTSYTVSNLEHGKVYHFNLFAVNRRTNLSFPYGRTTLKYEPRSKPAGLRDGKVSSVNLKKQDGRATFKFKVGKKAEEALHIYVMPCGGAVDVEVTLKGEVVVPRKLVYGYERFRVMAPERGQRYVLRVTAPNSEELRRISAVEVFATTRPGVKFTLPELPPEPQVHEYDSMRRCDSVTVGWVPSPDPRVARYCVFAREDRLRDLDTKRPNQCSLDTKLKRNTDFAMMHCQDRIEGDNRSVITQTIGNLKHGRHYIVQVTVSKVRGKTLSYDLLQVQTKPVCT